MSFTRSEASPIDSFRFARRREHLPLVDHQEHRLALLVDDAHHDPAVVDEFRGVVHVDDEKRMMAAAQRVLELLLAGDGVAEERLDLAFRIHQHADPALLRELLRDQQARVGLPDAARADGDDPQAGRRVVLQVDRHRAEIERRGQEFFATNDTAHP
jgi:hypothetical protein